MTKDWFKELKEGDYVFIKSRNNTALHKVQGITPTGRIVVNNIQFINGTNSSDKWNPLSLCEATEEKIASYRKSIFLKKVCFALNELDKITYEQAQKINEILNLGVEE